MASRELTGAEAAEISGYSRSRLTQLATRKIIQARKVGPIWLFEEVSLRAYMATSHKSGPKPGSKRTHKPVKS